jgi:hypothetical protein
MHMTVGLPKRKKAHPSPWADRTQGDNLLGKKGGKVNLGNHRDLFKQLFFYSALIGVSYAISSALPLLVLIGSVSWNLFYY